MFSNPNPHYFIVLSQSDSISAAAEKLHVSHQNLSKYIKNLEQEYRITLFTRMPRLKLTEAGEAMLETMRELAFSEENLQIRLEEIRHAKTGKLRVGAPEGRFRIVFPELLVRMKELYPQVRIEPVAAPSHALQKMLRENELDLVLIDRYFADLIQFRHLFQLDERLFLVISRNLLQTVFSEKSGACRAISSINYSCALSAASCSETTGLSISARVASSSPKRSRRQRISSAQRAPVSAK